MASVSRALQGQLGPRAKTAVPLLHVFGLRLEPRVLDAHYVFRVLLLR
jgi:hypothetical protein